jgi:hypothetical protein
VQFTLWHSDKSRWRYMRQPHGEGFKQIYRILRDRFVNNPREREKFLWKCNHAENLEYVG